ncbi:hypothetical protein [Streptomyces sp. NPDC001816]|uniref:hypothetical protein n=1 Tax=Streptomyces sp. NPDC001816 TaxID=3364612 RepID=UPI0036969C21
MHAETTGTLRRDAIGLREALFQSITAMAPAATVAAGAVVLLVLMRHHPERIAETARVHAEELDRAGHRQDGTVPR